MYFINIYLLLNMITRIKLIKKFDIMITNVLIYGQRY